MSNNIPHKYAEVIKAWADGKQIQYRPFNGSAWVNWNYREDLKIYEAWYWRIKPETVKYRLYLYELQSKKGKYTVFAADDEAIVVGNPGFIRWLGDWQEVEV